MNETQLTELIVVAEFFAVGFDLRLFGFIFYFWCNESALLMSPELKLRLRPCIGGAWKEQEQAFIIEFYIVHSYIAT